MPVRVLEHFIELAIYWIKSYGKILFFFYKQNGRKIFFVIAIYQASNFTLALPFYEKKEKKWSNIENVDGTHFIPL